MAGGFRPINTIGNGSYSGQVQTYGVNATHATLLAVGDLVVETGESDTDGLAEVDAAAATGLITGAIVAVDFNISNLERKGLPALTAGTVKVAVGNDLLLEAESSTTVAAGDVGANADIVATAATTTGNLVNSNMTVDTTSPGSATAQVRIVSRKDGGTAAGTTLVVRINESTIDGVVGV